MSEGTCYGRLDVPPRSDDLEATAAALRARWHRADARPVRVFSSPLQRCARLASALAGEHWPVPEFDPRIAEMHFGDWEGLAWSEIPRDQMSAWRADIGRVAPPGGESLADVADRLLAFVDERLSDPALQGNDVVVVTHVGVIQTALRVLRGEPMRGFGDTRIDFGSISTLVRGDQGFAIERCNEAP